MSDITYQIDDDEPLSEGVVRALSVSADARPDDICPLHESIDPDALDDLFDERSSRGQVVFFHEGYQITACSDGEISLQLVE